MKPTARQLQNRIKWVEGLESGKYKQGQNQLRDGDHYCCLGVACDVLGIPAARATPEYDSQIFTYEGQTEFLPRSAKVKLGFGSVGREGISLPHPVDTEFGITCNTLTELNDIGEMSFEEIAQIIRKQFINPYMSEKQQENN